MNHCCKKLQIGMQTCREVQFYSRSDTFSFISQWSLCAQRICLRNTVWTTQYNPKFQPWLLHKIITWTEQTWKHYQSGPRLIKQESLKACFMNCESIKSKAIWPRGKSSLWQIIVILTTHLYYHKASCRMLKVFTCQNLLQAHQSDVTLLAKIRVLFTLSRVPFTFLWEEYKGAFWSESK